MKKPPSAGTDDGQSITLTKRNLMPDTTTHSQDSHDPAEPSLVDKARQKVKEAEAMLQAARQNLHAARAAVDPAEEALRALREAGLNPQFKVLTTNPSKPYIAFNRGGLPKGEVTLEYLVAAVRDANLDIKSLRRVDEAAQANYNESGRNLAKAIKDRTDSERALLDYLTGDQA